METRRDGTPTDQSQQRIASRPTSLGKLGLRPYLCLSYDCPSNSRPFDLGLSLIRSIAQGSKPRLNEMPMVCVASRFIARRADEVFHN